MKRIIIGTFASRDNAENAIGHLKEEMDISDDDISFIYRDTSGRTREEDTRSMGERGDTPAEGAKQGAIAGGALGALAGIATVMGVIPVIGPIFAAGPLVAALGIGGAAGTTVAGAATGAAAGGLIGALANMGVARERAEQYASQIVEGSILVIAHDERADEVADAFVQSGAIEAEIYMPNP
ncbi:low temperature-induced protein [Candidatus Parcubacteria bacterium]|nr:MAG: low temperature-induced protein [Candidatus Parcubacteria bacterium]